MRHVIAIDQGTTATKIHRLDEDGGFTTLESITHRQIYPQPGWVEHDPRELLDAVRRGVLHARSAAAVGIDNQGETVVAWDAQTGEPLGNAIVWQDSRTQPMIDALRASGAESTTLALAGLALDPYFSASKLRWILDHLGPARTLLEAGRLRLGTTDSYFLDRLCGRYVTDVTTASRTSLMNLRTGRWDPDLCERFGVPMAALPEIVASTGELGMARADGVTVPVRASLVDQQAALYGHGCRHPGDIKITFGTGAFVLCVAGASLPAAAGDVSPTVAWQRRGEPPTYAFEGGVYNAASAIDWVRKLGLFSEFESIDDYDGPPAIARGLVFVPALSGLACPHWDRSAAGLWLGMGLDTTAADLVRAALEGVALRAAQVVRAMRAHVTVAETISIDGGVSRNRYFCQFLSAATGCGIRVAHHVESTGLGIARLAAESAGLATVPARATPDDRVHRSPPLSGSLLLRFDDAVGRCRGWRQT